jgi:trigger factor
MPDDAARHEEPLSPEPLPAAEPAPAAEPPAPEPTAPPTEAPAEPAPPAAEVTSVSPAEIVIKPPAVDAKPAEDDIPVTYEVTPVGPCRKKVAVTIGRDVFEKEMDKQLRELGEKVVTPGFRKGHAPRRIIEKRYAKAVAADVKITLAARGVQKAVTEAGLEPLGEPELGELKMDEGGPLTIDATMDVRPTVDVGDYQALTVTRRAVSVGEKEIDDFIKNLLERRGRIVPVADADAVIGPDDLPVCDYKVTAGETVLLERTDVTVPMRMRNFPEVPELGTDRMLGAKVGAAIETAFELANEKWPAEHRGREATLAVSIHEIKRLDVPELTPELIQEFGATDREDLRAKIEIALLREMERDVQKDVDDQITRQLLEQATFDLPESLVKAESERRHERIRLQLMQAGVPEDDLDARTSALAESSRESAERDLKLHFIYDHIAEQEDIAVEPRDLEQRVARIAANYDVSPRQARLLLERQGSLDSLRVMIREQKVIDWLLEHAAVTELEPEVDTGVAAPETT